jgi:glutathione S-transferase
VIKHRANIVRVNPLADHRIDEALRCALTAMMTGKASLPPADADVGLRYVRDRISVPRDMSIHAAQQLRSVLESTAALVGDQPGPAISMQHRRDPDPASFAAAPG